jgi:hypothetical protein
MASLRALFDINLSFCDLDFYESYIPFAGLFQRSTLQQNFGCVRLTGRGPSIGMWAVSDIKPTRGNEAPPSMQFEPLRNARLGRSLSDVLSRSWYR